MSEVLATSPPLPGEASTVEGRLADIMEQDRNVLIGGKDGYVLSESDLNLVIGALRHAHSLKTSTVTAHVATRKDGSVMPVLVRKIGE